MREQGASGEGPRLSSASSGSRTLGLPREHIQRDTDLLRSSQGQAGSSRRLQESRTPANASGRQAARAAPSPPSSPLCLRVRGNRQELPEQHPGAQIRARHPTRPRLWFRCARSVWYVGSYETTLNAQLALRPRYVGSSPRVFRDQVSPKPEQASSRINPVSKPSFVMLIAQLRLCRTLCRSRFRQVRTVTRRVPS